MTGDANNPILFYGPEFYVFSNFSSFAIEWKGKRYMTSEHVYQSEKFSGEELKERIRNTRSAHDAFTLAREYHGEVRADWEDVRLSVMKDILRAKAAQHPYVRKKLLESGGRELVEDSRRDAFWGWGHDRRGENHLGKLWMEVREEVRSKMFGMSECLNESL